MAALGRRSRPAWSIRPLAASSPFTLGIAKPDGQAALDGLRLELPEGLLADIKDNLGSRVGTATVAAGPGSSPFSLSGPVVLEGRYDDAPYSLRVTVPAKAGPFDLGEVVVRQKIYVDPRDAHVTVVSDPLPTIVKGVPVRLQKLSVSVDKPGFMRNPTSCAEKSIGGVLHSVAGTTAQVASRFQVGGCEGLDLRPKLKLTLTGRAQTAASKRSARSAKLTTRVAKKAAATPKSLGLTDGGHPDLDAHLTMAPGGANLKQATVALPLTMALDPDNANGLCEPAAAAANTCPAASIVGNVTAISPILPDPLTGPVYFVRGERTDAKGKVRKTLPKLYVPLTGTNGVRVDLHASSDVNSLGQLVTTFDNIPDAPVSDFRLHISGGQHGILVVTLKKDLCAASADDRVGSQDFAGQNGKVVSRGVPGCEQLPVRGLEVQPHGERVEGQRERRGAGQGHRVGQRRPIGVHDDQQRRHHRRPVAAPEQGGPRQAGQRPQRQGQGDGQLQAQGCDQHQEDHQDPGHPRHQEEE